MKGLSLLSVAVISVVALTVTVWWLIHTYGAVTLPRFSTTGPVVKNGVAVIVVCGKENKGVVHGTPPGFPPVNLPANYAPEPGTGTWAFRERGDCTVFYHHPPDASQREARQARAQ